MRKIFALALLGCFISSPVLAYSPNEHPFANFNPNDSFSPDGWKTVRANTQENANAYCNVIFDIMWKVRWKGMSVITAENGKSFLALPLITNRPYIWAHMQNQKCIFNR